MFPKPAKKEKVKKKLSKARETTIAKEKKKAWKVFSEYIRRKDLIGEYGICYTCNKKTHYDNLQAGHWVEGHRSAAYINEEFVRPQCVQCNIFLHGNQGVFRDKIRKELGDERVNSLLNYSKTTVKITLEGYKKLTEKYTKLVEK